MPILLLLLAPILEVWIIVRVASYLGIVNTVFALLAGVILGGGIAKAQGRYIIESFQKSVAKGEIPSTEMFHSLLILIGGILLFIPGFLSDVMGLLFIIPGPRHLFAFWLRRKMLSGFNKGSFRVFSMGGFGGAGFGSQSGENQTVRDVTPQSLEASDAIIDVSPISKEEKPKRQ